MRSSIVLCPGLDMPPVTCDGSGSRYTLSLGNFELLTPSLQVCSSGKQVKIAFAPESFIWYSSSEGLYAALTQVRIPPILWTAQPRVR